MKSIMAFVVLSLGLPLAAAQDNFGAAGQAAPWLLVDADTRLSAMGDAGSALASDSGFQALNPAALAGLNGQAVSLTHRRYLLDSSVEHMAYALGGSSEFAFEASFDYLSFGQLDAYAIDPNTSQLVSAGSINPSAWHADLGAAWGRGPWAVGADIKWIDQTLDGSNSAGTIGADLGAQWRQVEEGLQVGAAILNLGGQLEGADLPLAYRASLAYVIKVRDKDSFTLACDALLPAADSSATTACLGAEYSILHQYALRFGYKTIGNTGQSGLTVGIGTRVQQFGFDYAYSSIGDLGASNQFTLGLRF